MDAVTGLFVQGLGMIVVIGFYLFVGMAVATLAWFIYRRVHDRWVASHPAHPAK
jgi:hypothetical protein